MYPTAPAILLVGIVIASFLPLSPASRMQNRSPVSVGGSHLAGTVVEPGTDVPIAGVRVTLWCDRCSEPLRETFTDLDGSYQFPRIPADTYQIAASKPGWLITRYGQTKPQRAATSIVLGDRESRSDLTIRLLRGGVIDGRITGQNSESLAGVVIQCYRMRYTSTGRGLDPIDSTTTDDQGHYRFFSLSPGEYVVRATPPRLRTITTDAVQPVPHVGYTSTFFPGVSTVGEAARLGIAAGDVKSGVDLSLSLVPLRTIRGQLLSPGVPLGKVTITRMDASGLLRSGEPVVADVQPNGSFLIAGVPTGLFEFVVRAYPRRSAQDAAASISAGTLWGTARVTVGKDNDTDLSIPLFPGATITGQVKVADGATSPLPHGGSIALLATGQAALQPGEMLAGRIEQDGSFAIGGIPPGVFHVFTAGLDSPWIADSITLNGRDVLMGSVEVGTVDVPGVAVTLTNRPAKLTGSLTVPLGAVVTDYTVIAFPADPQAREQRPRAVYAARLKTDGRFSLPVVPGYYLLAVTDDIEEFAWFDAMILQRLASGSTPVVVLPGEQKVQNLQIRSR